MADKTTDKKKTEKTMVSLTFSGIVATNPGVNVLEFVEKGNEYLAEPTNADGCFVAFRLTKCEAIIKDKNKKQDQPKEDKLDRFMHFTFRGFRFTVDREEMEVYSNGKGIAGEILNDVRDESGLYHYNVETSN